VNDQELILEAGFMRQLLKLGKRYGAKYVTPGRSKHGKMIGLTASGQQVKLTVPNSPSDNARTLKNIERDFRRAGLVDRNKAERVKAALVKNTTTTQLKPKSSPKERPSLQSTFKQFSQKYQPNQKPESELSRRMSKAFDKRLDDLIQSVRGKKKTTTQRRRISRSQLDAMDIPQRQKDDLIKQGLVERYTQDQKNKKLKYQYDQRNNPDNYIQRDPMLDLLKQKKGLPLSQLAPLEKENQMPGKFSDTFIRLKEPTVDTLRQRVKRYGNIQRMSDIYSNYP